MSAEMVPQPPLKLDELITQNRDIARLAIATTEQVATLSRIIPPVSDDDLRGAVSDWRFIAYEVTLPREPVVTHVHLLGDNAAHGTGTKVTSPVVAIDLATRLVVTHSGSIYRLIGEGGNGEPTFHQLLQVCGAFWYWGRGEALGVLHVFY